MLCWFLEEYFGASVYLSGRRNAATAQFFWLTLWVSLQKNISQYVKQDGQCT
jgi:hypothetical protein